MALNLDDYTKTSWAPEMPITQDRMNKLEDGVYVNREALQSLDNTVTTQSDAITTLNTNVSTKLNQEQVDNRIVLQLSGISDNSMMGRNAWTAIANATTSANPTPYGSLADRFDDDETLITNLRAALGQIRNTDTNELEDIYTSNNTVANALINLSTTVGAINEEIGASLGRNPDTGVPNTQFRQHMSQIDDAINTLKNSMNTIFDSTGVDDNNQRVALSVRMAQLIALDAEVQAAHREVAEGASPDTLAQRFHDIEVAISGLQDNKVNISDIINDLTHTDVNKPLSANMGKTLKDTIGGTYSPTNTVASAIATAQSTAETNAKNYTDSLLGSEFSDQNTVAAVTTDLDERVIDIEAELSTAHTSSVITESVEDEETHEVSEVNKEYDSIDSRFEAIEAHKKEIADELNAAHVSSVVRTEVQPEEEGGEITYTDTTYDTLNERLEAIEGHAAASRNDIDTIANELSMFDVADNISGAHTRIDQIETNLVAMANEIGMLQNEAEVQDMASAITGATTRIDTIESEIDAAHRTVEEGEPADTLNARFTDIEAKISHPAENEDAGGLTERLTSLEGEVRHASTGLAATKAIADANKAAIGDDNSGLTQRIKNLEDEPKSATEVVTALPQTGDETKDYLVGPNEDGKYFYYKWINNTWNLISGGGSGEGNTSGYVGTLEDYNTLEEKDENTDYYVLESDGYHHYRWVEDTEIEIGVPESKKYNINIETVESDDGAVNYLSIYEFNYDEDNIIDDATNLDNIVSKRLRRILLPATGGGGGTTNTMKVIQVPSRNIYKAANSNTSTYLRFFFTTGEENEPASYTLTIDGTSILDAPVNIISGNPDNKAYTWPVDENDVELSTEDAAALGFYSIDITKYCNTIGTHSATVTVALDSNTQITAPATWNINTFNLSLTSNFTNNAIVNTGSTVNFNYIPSGNVEKTVHFKLDDTEIDTITLAARINTTQTYTIPAQSEPGAHKLEVYLTANSGMVKSASIFRDIIWQAAGDSTIILASPYRNNQETLTQYSTIDIPYTIAGGTGNYNVSYYVDDFENSVNEITLINNNTSTWSYKADTVGNHTLRIKCEESYIDIELVVTELQNVDIAPVTANLVLDFNPSGITNTSAKRLWSNDNYSLTVSDNFDWYNGGYGSDVNGDYFLVKAGTRATFNYYMFNKYTKTGDNGATSDASVVYRDGAELKIIFKTDAVRSADAVWFSNMGASSDSASAKEVGIQLNVHNGWLKTDAAGESTKSYLYFPYSEEDKIELDININKETEPNSVYCMSYEDGCPSRAYPYTNVEVLYQSDAKPIVIGSDDCDVYIYRMRIYDSSLTTEKVLRNFIADGKDVNESIDRYNRNCIYYDTQAEIYTPYEGPDTVLDPVRLAQKLPDVKILMLDTPHFTTSKKDFIPYSTLRCIHADGGTVYPSRGKEDNWFFGNGYHAGQGTTSDKYGNAGRNVDFLFNCDGVHNPSDKIKPDKGFIEGYQSYVIKGYGTDEEEEPEYCTDWKGDSGKISLTSTSVPNNFFNLKVNIASSENVNNALFQKRYNDYLPYLSPAYLRDNRIKNDMEFVPAILFVRENDDEHTTTITGDYTVVNYTNHTEFNDKEWHFYALGNIGDSKKSDYTRAYDPTDMNEFTLEISDNNTNNSQFQSGVYMKNGERTIEAYTLEQDMDDGEIIEGSFTATSSESDITIETTDYLYPIDRETEWEVLDEEGKPKNMRYWSLMNEGFDGDHSFEMRYACKGDYRDGKVVNDTTGKAKTQLALNTKVWQEFYTWLVTSSDEQFINELDQWVVKSAVAYFYAFTHYYTMIDNRAKNTFWHFAKTGKHRIVSHPSANLLHIYEEADGEVTEKTTEPGVWEGTFKPTEDTAIVSEKTYYTQYAFDMWSYDMDTAAGIDNNGELIFPYGKEDTDYRIDGDPASGPVFNGAGSIFWARLRKNCNSDITTAFTGVKTECFNANNLITQFDRFQNCYPEAIWRLDVERKYIRPFTGDKGIKDSNPYQEIDLTRKETRFLGDMMQGRKKYQRRQWVKNQAAYFGSKYFLPIISDNNQFDMVCYTIGGQEVLPNWDLTITPYQDLYIRVDYGETPKNPVRAKAGQPVEITCPFNSMNESRIRIYGADYIQALAGKPIKNEQGEIIGANSLASLYFRGNSFSNTHKLRKLVIGSENSSYNNSQFTTLNLSSDSPILEELDIQNCSGLTGALDLSGATALKTIKAQGTALTSISLPSSTNIENLYLPTTISTLMLIAAKRLKNISFTDKNGDSSIANLTSLILNDSDYSNTINWIDIAGEALAHLINLQLINLNYASITDIDSLAPFANRKDELGTMQNDAGETVSRINLTGLIHVTGNYSEVEKEAYEDTWTNLTLDVSGATLKPKYRITYKYDDYLDDSNNTVKGTVIKEIYIARGEPILDIYEYTDPITEEKIHILNDMPSRDSTIRKTYQFGLRSYGAYLENSGWRQEGQAQPMSVTGVPTAASNMTIYTYFKEDDTTYNIKWYLRKNFDGKPKESTFVKESANPVPYGGGEEEEAPTVIDIHKKGLETATVEVSGGQVTYSIFNGWEKLPVNITPTVANEPYYIYAKWEEATVPMIDLFNDVSSLTPAQLLVLSALNNTNRETYSNDAAEIRSQVSYTLGHDNNDSGIELIGPNATRQILRLDLPTSTAVTTSIQPLSSSNDAFTIAFDYCLNENATYGSQYRAAIIASCYSVDNTAGTVTGFALYNNLNSSLNSIGPRVGFGDMFNSSAQSKAIGSTININSRNIVVLRHPAGASYLDIYTTLNESGTINPEIISQRISWNNSTSDAYLTFGQITSNTSSDYTAIKSITTRAQSTIYWAKYWPSDLGIGECKRIAMWPHETMTFAFTNLESYATAGDRAIGDAPTPALGLTTISGSTHGKIMHSIADTTVGSLTGWGTSRMREVCNGSLMLGLPTQLQSILCKVNTAYFNLAPTSENSMTQQYLAQIPEYSRDYIAVPSARSLGNSSLTSDYDAEELNNTIEPYSWLSDNTSVNVYEYNSTGTWVTASASERAFYLNLRFPGYITNGSSASPLRIFRINGASIPSSSTIQTEISKISGGIKTGDIFISAEGIAYMYISDDDVTIKGLQNELNSGIFATTTGAWLKAAGYWTRSMGHSQQRNNYVYVDTAGILQLSETRSADATGLNLNYSIQI